MGKKLKKSRKQTNNTANHSHQSYLAKLHSQDSNDLSARSNQENQIIIKKQGELSLGGGLAFDKIEQIMEDDNQISYRHDNVQQMKNISNLKGNNTITMKLGTNKTGNSYDQFLNNQSFKSTTSSDTLNSNSSPEDTILSGVKHEPKKSNNQRTMTASPNELLTSFRNKDQSLRITKNPSDSVEELRKTRFTRNSNEIPFQATLSNSDKKRLSNTDYLSQISIKEEDLNILSINKKKVQPQNSQKSMNIGNTVEDFIESKPYYYLKANKFFIADDLSLQDIFQKIYFECYSYDDLKEYMFPALRKIKNKSEYFDILFVSIKNYCVNIKEIIQESLKTVLIKAKIPNQHIIHDNHVLQEYGSYKKFNKHATDYTNIIKKFYELYKYLEMLSGESEKISSLYLDNFIEKNKKIKFNCIDLHRKIFVSFVYKDPYIQDFTDNMITLFEEKQFFCEKYPMAAMQIRELNELLENTFYGDSNKIILYEEDMLRNFSEDDDDTELNTELFNNAKNKSLMHNNNNNSPNKYYMQDQINFGNISPNLDIQDHNNFDMIETCSDELNFHYINDKKNISKYNNSHMDSQIDIDRNHYINSYTNPELIDDKLQLQQQQEQQYHNEQYQQQEPSFDFLIQTEQDTKKKKNKRKRRKNKFNKDNNTSIYDIDNHNHYHTNINKDTNLMGNEDIMNQDYSKKVLSIEEKIDLEIQEFEKRLELMQNECNNSINNKYQRKIKPNLSDDWLNSLKLKVKKYSINISS